MLNNMTLFHLKPALAPLFKYLATKYVAKCLKH